MAQTLKLKRSAVTGQTPNTTQLALGEVAINTFDGRVFFKQDNGTEIVREILTNAGNSVLGVDENDTVTVNGTSTFTSPATFSDTATFNSTTSITGTTTISGATTLSGTTTDITGAATFESTVDFDDTTTFTGLATFNGGITVQAGDAFTFDSVALAQLKPITFKTADATVVYAGYLVSTTETAGTL